MSSCCHLGLFCPSLLCPLHEGCKAFLYVLDSAVRLVTLLVRCHFCSPEKWWVRTMSAD